MSGVRGRNRIYGLVRKPWHGLEVSVPVSSRSMQAARYLAGNRPSRHCARGTVPETRRKPALNPIPERRNGH